MNKILINMIKDYPRRKSLLGWVQHGPITRARSKRFQEEFGERLNFLMDERKEEAKHIYFSQLIE